jgi:tripartite-type tricarboxylate transporter receptor subunit TctC
MDNMNVNRRQFLTVAAASAITPVLNADLWASGYPTRPVHVMVGFPAGGGADILTRIVAEWLQTRLGQPFVVENRPGAATNLATEAVIRAPADGYTLLATTTSNLLNGALYDDLKYDFIRDISPVASLTVQPLVLDVNPSVPARSVPEFIAYAKANPGKINVGNFGAGTISHLAAEAFRQATGIDVVHVPFRGSPAMLTDLIAGHIQAAFDNIPTSLPHIKAGRLHVLAVGTPSRTETLPDVPAMRDFIPDFEAFTIAGIGAPRHTPADIIERLNGEINAGLADPKMSARLAGLGVTIRSGSPADFGALIARETERWSKVIRSSGIKMSANQK